MDPKLGRSLRFSGPYQYKTTTFLTSPYKVYIRIGGRKKRDKLNIRSKCQGSQSTDLLLDPKRHSPLTTKKNENKNENGKEMHACML